ncbi:MAG: hypothetical protein ACFFAS_11050 [Promethearchaeota archaeon]
MPQYEIKNKNKKDEDIFYYFLENELKELITNEKKELQRKKFSIINKLISDLYNNKNSKEHFKLISNQIILLLTLTNEKDGFDIFYDEDENEKIIKKNRTIFGDILKGELV